VLDLHRGRPDVRQFEAVIAAAITAVVFSLLWYGLPLARRRGGDEPEEGS
jgi:hypothetical protein